MILAPCLDESRQTLLFISEVAVRCRTHTTTVLRWIKSGVRAVDGTNQRLCAARFGGRWMILESDLDTFTRRLSDTETAEAESSSGMNNFIRRSELTEKRLDAIGI